jgi:hypothetical protein
MRARGPPVTVSLAPGASRVTRRRAPRPAAVDGSGSAGPPPAHVGRQRVDTSDTLERPRRRSRRAAASRLGAARKATVAQPCPEDVGRGIFLTAASPVAGGTRAEPQQVQTLAEAGGISPPSCAAGGAWCWQAVVCAGASFAERTSDVGNVARHQSCRLRHGLLPRAFGIAIPGTEPTIARRGVETRSSDGSMTVFGSGARTRSRAADVAFAARCLGEPGRKGGSPAHPRRHKGIIGQAMARRVRAGRGNPSARPRR